MKESQEAFEARRRGDWDALRDLLAHEKGLHRMGPQAIARASNLYRNTASDLMEARARGFTPEIIHALDQLAARAHASIYAAPPYRLGAIAELLLFGFPSTLRRHARAFWLATALFTLPAILGFSTAMVSRHAAMQILPEEMVESAETMYANGFKGRDEETDATMAGFYIRNNVGIAFQCFATGILLGIGSIFYLVYNGLTIGTFIGLVTASGHGRNLFTFVSGHGAFELTAIAIAGTAGIVMGYSLVETRGLTRMGSLQARARDIAQLVLGAALMLIAAAFVEGFWSPSGVPMRIKWVASGLMWLFVIVYLARAGQPRRRMEKVEAA